MAQTCIRLRAGANTQTSVPSWNSTVNCHCSGNASSAQALTGTRIFPGVNQDTSCPLKKKKKKKKPVPELKFELIWDGHSRVCHFKIHYSFIFSLNLSVNSLSPNPVWGGFPCFVFFWDIYESQLVDPLHFGPTILEKQQSINSMKK